MPSRILAKMYSATSLIKKITINPTCILIVFLKAIASTNYGTDGIRMAFFILVMALISSL